MHGQGGLHTCSLEAEASTFAPIASTCSRLSKGSQVQIAKCAGGLVHRQCIEALQVQSEGARTSRTRRKCVLLDVDLKAMYSSRCDKPAI